MNLPAVLRRLLAAAILAVALPGFAARLPWPDSPYGHHANNTRLDTVLADFAAAFSLSLALQPDVGGQVNGRFSAATPAEFLTRLGGMYGFVWYTHAGTLFVSRATDVTTQSVAAPGGNVAAMRKALTDLGVLESRFGWGELAEQGVVMVSGPPSYVKLVEQTIRNLPARAQQLRVFRLQHASATDRTVQYRGQGVTTPGVASMLQSMVGGGAPPHVAGSGAATVPPNVPASLPSGTVGGGLGPALRPAVPLVDVNAPGADGAAATAAQGAAPSATSGGPRPMVRAEPRLNAVIIQDLPERLPLYEQLIAQLDVPTMMVEIEAMIVDVSSDRADELGVDWSGRIGRFSASFNAIDGAALGFSSPAVAAGHALLGRLRLMQSKGDADIRSRPAVLTSDNMAALLDLSETFYVRSQGERVAAVTPVTTGTSLRVSPHVVRQGGKTLVQLKIDIEDGQVNDARVDTLPTVSNSTVSTEATVLDGESLLIAGYGSDRKINARRQLPILGDLPAIGTFFSDTTRTVQKRERMFVIRPRVVGYPGGLARGGSDD